MWFRLALALGMTVREAQARIGADEFAEWSAYYELEPWGEMRADLRAGIVAATVANANRASGQRPYKAKDFMPEFEHRPKTSTEHMAAVFNMFFAAHNAQESRA